MLPQPAYIGGGMTEGAPEMHKTANELCKRFPRAPEHNDPASPALPILGMFWPLAHPDDFAWTTNAASG